MATAYKIYKGHNSPILIEIQTPLEVKYSVAQMATISRAYLKYIPSSGSEAEIVDSELHDDVFDFDKYATQGKIEMDAGMQPLTEGRDTKAEIVVYDTVYPEGRVIAQLNIQVSIEAYDDDLFISGNLSGVLDITESQTLVVGDLRQAICAISSSTISLQLPSMGEDQNGYWLDIIQGGTGDVVLTGADSDTIGDDEKTILTLSGTSTYTHTRIQYFHAITAWVVFRMGSIAGS